MKIISDLGFYFGPGLLLARDRNSHSLNEEEMSNTLRYDRYVIELPGDMFEFKTDFQDQAIYEARERARLYVIPCHWYARIISGEPGDGIVKVQVTRVRKRNA